MSWTASPLRADHILSEASNLEMWVQEAIFGHRFIKEQQPYMLVLETLSVCRARLLNANGMATGSGPIFTDPAHGLSHEAIEARVPYQGELRFILFEDRELDALAEDRNLTNDDRLRRWITHLNVQGEAVLRRSGAFDYLAERFDGRFQDLLQAVRILRGLEIEVVNDRHWTKRFVVPRGRFLHLGDIKPGEKSWTLDRIFFGRGGEMVYLMLNRSKAAQALGTLINDQFFSGSDPLDALAAALSPPKDRTTGDSTLGYLPYAEAPAYDRMGDDWLRLIGLPRLPLPQKVDPLSRITALNLVRYFGEVSAERLGRPAPPPLPMDFCDGKVRPLQVLCRTALMSAREAIGDAVASHVDSQLKASPRWQKAVAAADAGTRSSEAIGAIGEIFRLKAMPDKGVSPTPEEWRLELLKRAAARRNNQIEDLFLPLGKKAGFVMDRQKIGSWFCASDPLLEALVLANVAAPMSIEAFADLLQARYGIVVGRPQAERAYAALPVSSTDFEANTRAFERRLTSLGFVKRLSDDCAFVSNPFVAS
jgi:hypothetical protein